MKCLWLCVCRVDFHICSHLKIAPEKKPSTSFLPWEQQLKTFKSQLLSWLVLFFRWMHVVKTVSNKEGITLCLLKVVPSNSDIFQWWVNLIISTTTLTNIRRNRVFQPNSKKLTTIHSPATSGVLCKLLFYFWSIFYDLSCNN